MSRWIISLLVIVAAAAPLAAEQTWRLDANNTTYSYACGDGERLTIDGDGNELSLTGECGHLAVTGSDNRITIEAVASIAIRGNNNDVFYARASNAKKKPAIKVKGAANTVRRID